MSAPESDSEKSGNGASEEESPVLGTISLLSGPSGCGKSTLIREVMARIPELRFEVSCTTREMRDGEIPGISYHFLSEEEFESKVQQGLFLEHALVHGKRYGTLSDSVLTSIRKGEHVIMDIDVQGAQQVLRDGNPDIKRALRTIFVHPPSMAELEKRLRGRKNCTPDSIELRLANAPGEIAKAPLFDLETVNDDLEVTVREVAGMIQKRIAACR